MFKVVRFAFGIRASGVGSGFKARRLFNNENFLDLGGGRRSHNLGSCGFRARKQGVSGFVCNIWGKEHGIQDVP